MVYDLLGHLGDIDAETEIKYLSIITLNGDPFVFIPGKMFGALIVKDSVENIP